MFRIKPVRNPTIAKQSNISPSHSIKFTLNKQPIQSITLKKEDIKSNPLNKNIKNKINIGIQRKGYINKQTTWVKE
jgi:hypothetical protein